MLSRRQRGILATIGALAIGFVALEIGLRGWLSFFAAENLVTRWGSAEQVRRSVNLRYARHHYLPFIPRPDYRNGKDRHNHLGYRGEEIKIPKPEGVFRIACLGGSTTYTTSVRDYRLSYPALLQTALHRAGSTAVEVINAGCGRYSTWETLMNLQFRVLDLEPDLVIVYHGINDVHTRLVYPFSAYRGDNSGSRTPYVEPLERGWDTSVVLRILRTELGWRYPLSGMLFLRTFDELPTNYVNVFRRQHQSGRYPSGALAEHDVQSMLDANTPVYFERNLRNMAAICRAQGVGIVFMTFAFSDEFEDPLISSPEFVGALREQNERVRSLCRDEQLSCYDFAEAMPPDRVYWVDGRHVTEAGAHLKADLVAGYLLQSGLVPQPTR